MIVAPVAADACGLIRKLFARDVASIRRFPTGNCHWVYDATLDIGKRVVIRMTLASQRDAMRNAFRLNRHLRPKGVPLPEVLGTDLEGPFPTLVLERLEGTDLGDVIGDLDHASLDAIAGHVVAAQQAVQELPGAGRFGYAADAQDAPHSTWMDFLAASLSRSREHLARNALVNVRHADSVERLLTDIRDEAAKVQARPFLHDTTTKNVIVRPDGGFAGIVDVDDFCWGDARLAPALTLAAIQAFGGRECYVDTWMRQAGFSDDRLFRTYVVLMILGFLSEQGREFNGNEPAADVERTTRLVQVFEIAVANAWSR